MINGYILFALVATSRAFLSRNNFSVYDCALVCVSKIYNNGDLQRNYFIAKLWGIILV